MLPNHTKNTIVSCIILHVGLIIFFYLENDFIITCKGSKFAA